MTGQIDGDGDGITDANVPLATYTGSLTRSDTPASDISGLTHATRAGEPVVHTVL